MEKATKGAVNMRPVAIPSFCPVSRFWGCSNLRDRRRRRKWDSAWAREKKRQGTNTTHSPKPILYRRQRRVWNWHNNVNQAESLFWLKLGYFGKQQIRSVTADKVCLTEQWCKEGVMPKSWRWLDSFLLSNLFDTDDHQTILSEWIGDCARSVRLAKSIILEEQGYDYTVYRHKTNRKKTYSYRKPPASAKTKSF
jgi:hypothetical protein